MATITLEAAPAAAHNDTSGKSLLVRILDQIVESRMRKAMYEVQRYRHLVPDSEVEKAGYRVSLTGDAELPFTR
jgi:hypothetical protein